MRFGTIFFALYLLDVYGQSPQSIKSTGITGITSSATVIDNRSQSQRQNTTHTFCALGSGTWSIQIQYSDTSTAGPWTNFTGTSSTVTYLTATCAGVATGYHAYIRFLFSPPDCCTVSYYGTKYLYIPSTTAGGGGSTGTIQNTTSILKGDNTGNAVAISGSSDLPAHASRHQSGGDDEVATATPGANAIPKATSGGTLAAGWIPNPSAGTLGGIQSIAASTNRWINSISTLGVPTQTQPACTNLSDAAASCSTDTTVASNISSGTLPAARLPASVVQNNQNNTYGAYSDTRTDITTPTAPSAGLTVVYTKAGRLCAQSPSSVETCTGGGTGTPGGTTNAIQYNGGTTFSGVTPNATSTRKFLIQSTASSGVPILDVLASGDIPANAANTSGTAANLSGTPNLPNGTTATTQSANDNSTKLATTAYVDVVKFTNPMSTRGDLLYYGASGTTRLALGSNGQCLTSNGTDASWAACVLAYPSAGVPSSTGSAWGSSYTVGTAANNLVQLNSSAQLPAVDGSLLTGLSSGFADPMTTRGDIIYRAASAPDRLAIGGSGACLTSNGTDPVWASCAGAGAMVYPGTGVANSTGTAWGTSYAVGTSANNLVQLNGSAQLPAVSAALLTNFPTFNQNTTGTAAGLTAQYINWSASSGGTSIANKPTLGAMAAGNYPGVGVPNSTGSAWTTSYTVGTAANNLVQLNASSQLPAVSAALLTNFPTFNQNTTGTAAGLTAQYIDWSASTGGASIANKPSIPTVTGGACTNQAVTSISSSAVPTCTTITSAYVNTSIAKTGTDINTSNQVTVTHLSSPLPVNQGGTGTATPNLVSGTGISISGTWPNQTVTNTGGGGGGGTAFNCSGSTVGGNTVTVPAACAVTPYAGGTPVVAGANTTCTRTSGDGYINTCFTSAGGTGLFSCYASVTAATAGAGMTGSVTLSSPTCPSGSFPIAHVQFTGGVAGAIIDDTLNSNQQQITFAGPVTDAYGAGGRTLTVHNRAPTCTIASLPAGSVIGDFCYFTDAASASDCTTGLGSTKTLCIYNGTGWVRP